MVLASANDSRDPGSRTDEKIPDRALRTDLQAALVPFLLSRGLLLIVGYIGLRFFPLETDNWRAFPETLWLDGWARWDSAWLRSVVREGYFVTEAKTNTAFFPLFPWLAHGVATPLRWFMREEPAFYASAIVISYIAFYVALVGIHRLTRELGFEEDTATRALWLFAFFPYALFFSAAYSESLYLALAVWAFLSARRERWLAACILAALAAVTRIPGFLIAVGLFTEYLWSRKGRLDRNVGWFFITPIAVVALMLYFFVAFDDPFAFRTAQMNWGRGGIVDLRSSGGALWQALHLESPIRDLQRILFVGFVVAVVGLSPRLARRIGPGHAVFCAASILLPAASSLASIGRFVSVLFPVFILLASSMKPSLHRWAMATSAVFLAYLAYQFTNWGPVF